MHAEVCRTSFQAVGLDHVTFHLNLFSLDVTQEEWMQGCVCSFFNIIQHDLNNIWHFICASCLNHKQTNQTGAQGASSGNEQGLTCETESSLTTSAMNDYDCLPHSYSLSCWLQVTGGVNHGARC